MSLQQDIEWYEEGERDQDFLVHLAGLAIPRIAELKAMVVALTALARREHFVLDDDCWYSCPASGHCCRDDSDKQCDCGADETNAQIEALLAHGNGES